jgi:vancomycin resistance protein VanW
MIRAWLWAPAAALGASAAGWAAFGQPAEVCLAEYGTSVEKRTSSQRHNAQLSLDHLNGAIVGSGEVFSFNAVVGTFSRDVGYRKAPVSYNGQLIDSWGGGVCQTSTTLYNAALLAGMEIVERNRHRFAPSYVPVGRDAAVAFSNIDLRFRNPNPFPVRIQGTLKGDRLAIGIYGKAMPGTPPQVYCNVRQVTEPAEFRLGPRRPGGRVRNTGKAGWEVEVYRVSGDRRELISKDSYPAMHRIVDYR